MLHEKPICFSCPNECKKKKKKKNSEKKSDIGALSEKQLSQKCLKHAESLKVKWFL